MKGPHKTPVSAPRCTVVGEDHAMAIAPAPAPEPKPEIEAVQAYTVSTRHIKHYKIRNIILCRVSLLLKAL